jgi:hypothetical protein
VLITPGRKSEPFHYLFCPDGPSTVHDDRFRHVSKMILCVTGGQGSKVANPEQPLSFSYPLASCLRRQLA